MKQIDEALGLVHAWTRRIGLITLAIIACLMVLKAIGVPITWRTPALDQSTGVALAALAYVLHR